MASGNFLDDDQIESVLHGYEEMEQFASELDEREFSQWKDLSVPDRLTYLEDYVKQKSQVTILD